MLDQETKRKIDSARDILVGKIPDPTAQVDQITTALIYKFMDDMDQEAKEAGGKPQFFTGDFEKYSWPKIIDIKLSGQERLDLYIQAISQLPTNEKLPPLFREIFKNAFLPYRDAETLNLFLKEINGFTYDHSENLGNAFEYLLSILGSQGDAGQFRTPRHIIDFMVEVIDPKKEKSILDPACGTSGFLISSYKHILKNNSGNYNSEKDNYSFTRNESSASTVQIQSNGKYKGEKLTPADKRQLQKNIMGYDISPKMVKLSLVNMYLHNFKNPKIYEYDTLTSSERWGNDFNMILANPPFMSPKGGIRPHKKFSIEANRSEVLFVDYIMEHLTINGRAAIIVPEGIIFKSDKAYKALRKMLMEDQFLWSVVSLPAKVFEPYSGVKTSILFLDKKRAKNTNEILFVDVQNDGFDLGATRRKIDKNDLPEAFKILKSWKREKKEQTNLAHWVNKKKITKSGDYNLTGNRYRTDIYIDLKNISQNFKEILTPLSENLLKITEPYIEWAKKMQEQRKLYRTIIKGLEGPREQINYLINTSEFLETTKRIQDTVKRMKESLQSHRIMTENLKEINNQINYIANISESLKTTKTIQDTIKQIQNSPITHSLKAILEAQKQLEEASQHQKKYPMIELGKIMTLEYGKPLKKGERKKGDYPVFGSNGIIGYHDEYLVKGPFIIVGRKGTAGAVTYSDINGYPIDTTFYVQLKNTSKSNLKFIYFIMQKLELKKINKQAGVPGLNRNDAYNIKIPLPPLEIQKEIVNEIEGYQKIIDAAKQIIESWKPIIKIDPTWSIMKLGDFCEVEYGFTDTAKSDGDTRFIRITDIDQSGHIIETDQKFINISEQSKKYLLKKNDIIITRTGATFGKTALFDKEYKAIFASYLIRLKFLKANSILPRYYLLFSQSESYWNQAHNLVTGGAQPQFNGNVIKKIKIPLPPLEVQKEIILKITEEQSYVESCKKLITLNKEKIQQKIAETWSEK